MRRFYIKPTRVAVAVLMATLLTAVAIKLQTVAAQGTLYNGTVLPPDFLQQKAPTQVFHQPTYLTSPPAVIPINIGRQLFVDDFLIESTNLQRTAHRPVFYSGNPVLSGGTGRDFSGIAFPYSDGVWYDPDSKLFKMWYDGGYGNDVAYAYSQDGKNWTKPNIAEAPVPNSNMVLTIGGGRESDTVWRDSIDPDPARRYKAFALYYVPLINMYFSADGIHWSEPQPNNMNSLSDRPTVFYNPFRGVWVESARQFVDMPASATRPERGARVRYYSESRDLVTWTDPTGVFWVGPDELDPPYAGPGGAYPELYALDAVAYESVMVGMFSWFHPGPTYKPSYDPGPNLVELGVGFSRDGYQWVRPTRGFGAAAFIPASNVDGTWNCCNTQSAGGGFLVVGDELWFYFSARDARKPATGNGSTGLATLRRDGFYSMDAVGYEGVLTTRPVSFTGNHLFVNTAAAGGRVQAEVLDTFGNVIAPFSRSNSWAVSGDTTRAEIMWAGGDLSTLANRPVKFRFYVLNASLYSFWVTPAVTGASYGYVAAGGPGLTGATDTVGSSTPSSMTGTGPAPVGSGSASGPRLYLQQQINNEVSGWLMGGPTGASIQSSALIGMALPGWTVCAAADMNGDGITDLIVQNTTTFDVSIWFMTEASGWTMGPSPIIYRASPNWRVKAAADMNGDGVPDLVLQNEVTNTVAIWFMRPGGLSFSSAPEIRIASAGWKVAAAGDINRDGVSDLVFQNQTSGQLSVWFMASGGMSFSSAPVVASPLPGWALVGVSDFNRDGTLDYVFQNRATGEISVWYLIGTQGVAVSSAPIIATPIAGWLVMSGR